MVELLTEDLSLQPEDVAGLWVSIYEVVNPSNWNPTQGKPGNKIDHTILNTMRDCSLGLICKFITQLTVGPAAQCNISASHRIQFLSELTSCKEIPEYPIPSLNIPSAHDQKRWEVRPLHYPLSYRSVAYEALIHRLSHIESPASLRNLLPPPSPQIDVDLTESTKPDNIKGAADLDIMKPNPHEPESSQSLAIDEQYDSDGDTLHVSGEKDSENPFGCNESLGGESVTGVTGESFGESFYESETEEHRGISVYRDSETEKYFCRPEFDPNQDPGPSLQLEIPGEEILVTPDMLERAEALCAEQEDADTVTVSAVLTYEKSWSEVTQ